MDEYYTNSFECWLERIYERSIELSVINDDNDIERVKRFVYRLYTYYTKMIQNGFIDSTSHAFINLTDLDAIILDEEKVKAVNSGGFYTEEPTGKHIYIKNIDYNPIIPERDVYIIDKELEKIYDYHEISHLLSRDIYDNTSKVVEKEYIPLLDDPTDRTLFRNMMHVGARSLNEFAADYISFTQVCPEYKGREQSIRDIYHYFGKAFNTRLLFYYPLSPVTEEATRLLFPDVKDIDERFDKLAKIIINPNPVSIMYDLLKEREDQSDVFIKIMNCYAALYETFDKHGMFETLQTSFQSYTTFKELKKCK